MGSNYSSSVLVANWFRSVSASSNLPRANLLHYMNKYIVAHFSLMNGELIHAFVEARSIYEAAVQTLYANTEYADSDVVEFMRAYPTYEDIQEKYLPAVEDWMSVLLIE